MDFYTLIAPAADIATSGTSARIAIPTASSGEIPRYIRVSSTNAARIRLGTSTVAALATDTLVQPADAMILQVPQGVTHIAAIQDSAAGKVNVAPLENM
jgi:hypothetical protein